MRSCKNGGGPAWSTTGSCPYGVNASMTYRFITKRNLETAIWKWMNNQMSYLDNGKNINLNIFLVHPWSKDIIKPAVRDQGFAAKGGWIETR